MAKDPYARPRGKACVEREYSTRSDGKINLWQRTFGKYWWKPWRVVAVIEKRS